MALSNHTLPDQTEPELGPPTLRPQKPRPAVEFCHKQSYGQESGRLDVPRHEIVFCPSLASAEIRDDVQVSVDVPGERLQIPARVCLLPTASAPILVLSLPYNEVL